MNVVESAILSTDLAMYFKKRDQFLELIDNGEFDWQSDEKKERKLGRGRQCGAKNSSRWTFFYVFLYSSVWNDDDSLRCELVSRSEIFETNFDWNLWSLGECNRETVGSAAQHS